MLQEDTSQGEISNALNEAAYGGYRLLYVYYPSQLISSLPTYSLPLLGNLVDDRVTFSCNLNSFDVNMLKARASKFPPNVVIRKHDVSDQTLSANLRNLAIASGGWSRFRIDSKVPVESCDAMFTEWIKNSLNRTIADEVFIVYHVPESGGDSGTTESDETEIAFITAKCRGQEVTFDLGAVAESYRRQGIAKTTLCYAILWALEQVDQTATDPYVVKIITQRKNEIACKCYQDFGFTMISSQHVHHVWLPEDMPVLLA